MYRAADVVEMVLHCKFVTPIWIQKMHNTSDIQCLTCIILLNCIIYIGEVITELEIVVKCYPLTNQ